MSDFRALSQLQICANFCIQILWLSRADNLHSKWFSVQLKKTKIKKLSTNCQPKCKQKCKQIVDCKQKKRTNVNKTKEIEDFKFEKENWFSKMYLDYNLKFKLCPGDRPGGSVGVLAWMGPTPERAAVRSTSRI